MQTPPQRIVGPFRTAREEVQIPDGSRVLAWAPGIEQTIMTSMVIHSLGFPMISYWLLFMSSSFAKGAVLDDTVGFNAQLVVLDPTGHALERLPHTRFALPRAKSTATTQWWPGGMCLARDVSTVRKERGFVGIKTVLTCARAVLAFLLATGLVTSCSRDSADGSSNGDPNEPEPPMPRPLYTHCSLNENCESGLCRS
jgi:hypothetical protein